MDIRDIKEVPTPKNKNVFRDIFTLQKELLDGYIKIEGLPQYPIDIDSKKNQVLLKDFIGRVTEEIGESYETIIPMIAGDMGENNYYLENSMEELADALHFLAEVIIYSGLEPEVIATAGFGDIRDEKDLFQFGDIGKGGITATMFHNYIKGLLWEQTYYLQMARNSLKNKPWKQTGMMTDKNIYSTNLISAFMSLLLIFRSFGLDNLEIYSYYYRKNRVNKFRQESKY